MTEEDGRVFLVGERRQGDQGRAPGTWPQCSLGDLSGLHRNRAPVIIISPSTFSVSSCMQGTQR